MVNMTVYKSQVAKEVSGAIFRGKSYEIRSKDPFIYVSRIISPDYIDIRLIAGSPKERWQVVGHLGDVASSLNPDIIGSYVTADVPFASMVAHQLQLPLFYMREDDKAHGRERVIEGMRDENIQGKEVLHIGDLITRGTTAFTLSNGVRNVGGRISYHLVIFDRLQGGSETLASLDPPVQLISLCEMDGNFYQAGLDSGVITQQDLDEVLRYRQDQRKWAIEFLTQNPDWLRNKIGQQVENGRLKKRDALEVLTVGYRNSPELDDLRKQIPEWLEELAVKEEIQEFNYKP